MWSILSSLLGDAKLLREAPSFSRHASSIHEYTLRLLYTARGAEPPALAMHPPCTTYHSLSATSSLPLTLCHFLSATHSVLLTLCHSLCTIVLPFTGCPTSWRGSALPSWRGPRRACVRWAAATRTCTRAYVPYRGAARSPIYLYMQSPCICHALAMHLPMHLPYVHQVESSHPCECGELLLQLHCPG